MIIEVSRDGNVVFEGDAELFLEDNDYDEDLSEFLNSLDGMDVGSVDYYYGNFCEEIKFEKLDGLVYNLLD